MLVGLRVHDDGGFAGRRHTAGGSHSEQRFVLSEQAAQRLEEPLVGGMLVGHSVWRDRLVTHYVDARGISNGAPE